MSKIITTDVVKKIKVKKIKIYYEFKKTDLVKCEVYIKANILPELDHLDSMERWHRIAQTCELLCKNKTIDEIASYFDLKHSTIKHYVENIDYRIGELNQNNPDK